MSKTCPMKTDKVRGEKMTKSHKERKKAVIPEMETKEQRFIRVCTPRVKRAIISIRMVKQTISGNGYSMTDAQIGTIVSRLNEEVLGLTSAFQGKNTTHRKEDIKIEL